jgi:hypothetical protein
VNIIVIANRLAESMSWTNSLKAQDTLAVLQYVDHARAKVRERNTFTLSGCWIRSLHNRPGTDINSHTYGNLQSADDATADTQTYVIPHRRP